MNTPTSPGPANQNPPSRAALLLFGYAGILFIAVYSLLGFFTPNYSAAYDTISSLELVKNGWIQQANFIMYGVMIACFTMGLAGELRKGINAKLIVLFQLLTTVGLIGDGIFIHEPMHMVCDLITFNSSLIVLLLFIGQFYKNSAWSGWIAYSVLTALVMMGFLTAFGIANKSHGLAGIYERLAVLPRTIWTIILTTRILMGRSLGVRVAV